MNKFILYMCLLATIACCQTPSNVDKTTKASLSQAKSYFKSSPKLSNFTTYIHLEDTIYANKSLPPKKIDQENTMPPDSLRVILVDKILSSFGQERKVELKKAKHWFSITIYIDRNGVLKETEYNLPNKFMGEDSKIGINELDLFKIDQSIEGMQLVFPEGWKEVGYAKIIYPVYF